MRSVNAIFLQSVELRNAVVDKLVDLVVTETTKVFCGSVQHVFVQFVDNGGGHCKCTVTQIIEHELIQKHPCLVSAVNVNIDYQSKHIYKLGDDTETIRASSSRTVLEYSSLIKPSCSKSNVENIPANKNDSLNEAWTDNMVKLLIHGYKHHRHKFESPQYNKKKVWEIISNDLEKNGYHKNGIKCDEKWRNLKKTYDKVRAENNKTGNAKVSWKFFDELQEILWHDPRYNPIATASSTGASHSTSNTVSNKSESETAEDEMPNKTTDSFSAEKYKKKKNSSSTSTEENEICAEESPKKKNLSPGEKYRKRTMCAYEIEQRKQKRHEEKMELKREMFEWCKNNFKADQGK